MYDLDKIPSVSAELIIKLNLAYPEKTPDPGTSLEDIMVDAGRRDIVRTLNAWFEELEGVSAEELILKIKKQNEI